jgi:hypothetical protein
VDGGVVCFTLRSRFRVCVNPRSLVRLEGTGKLQTFQDLICIEPALWYVCCSLRMIEGRRHACLVLKRRNSAYLTMWMWEKWGRIEWMKMKTRIFKICTHHLELLRQNTETDLSKIRSLIVHWIEIHQNSKFGNKWNTYKNLGRKRPLSTPKYRWQHNVENNLVSRAERCGPISFGSG